VQLPFQTQQNVPLRAPVIGQIPYQPPLPITGR
jgi:hypothetical protein